jgi:hypothetical protein
MKVEVRRHIIELVRSAQKLAVSVGIPNILQPGLVKEMIIADILGHENIISKRNADACDPNDPIIQKEKHAESMQRIWRNKYIYFAFFYKDSLDVKVIYEVTPEVLAQETERQLDRSSNNISHVDFAEEMVKRAKERRITGCSRKGAPGA